MGAFPRKQSRPGHFAYRCSPRKIFKVTPEFAVAAVRPDTVLVVMQVENDSDGEGSSSGDEVDRERVALYEKAKLRYYFAVVDCSSAVAADALYRECDGRAPGRSAQTHCKSG